MDCKTMNRKSSSFCPSRFSTSSNGGSGATGGNTNGNLTCADPLPEMQVPDSTGHIHAVTVAAATLNATNDQTFTTSPGGTDGHTHMITLAVANLGAIKAGGTATVTSTTTDSHTHMYAVSCTAA
jgi:hypothetical protein